MKIIIFSADKNRIIHILEEFNQEKNIDEVILLSTSELENKEFSFRDKNLKVANINNYNDFDPKNVAIFLVNKELTEKYIYNFIENDVVVLDESDYYLDDENIPTIIYNINEKEIKNYNHKNVIKLPSTSTIQFLESIKPLENISPIKRVVLSTYQSVSSIDKKAMDELFLHTKKIYENSFLKSENFKKQMAFNVLPQMGDVNKNNYYTEEQRIMTESNFINKTKVSATCAMVPVFAGNCQSINIEFEKSFEVDKIYEIYEDYPDFIDVIDRFEEFSYATPKESIGEENVLISRIRRDYSIKNGLNFWSVADNIKIEIKNIIGIINILATQFYK